MTLARTIHLHWALKIAALLRHLLLQMRRVPRTGHAPQNLTLATHRSQ